MVTEDTLEAIKDKVKDATSEAFRNIILSELKAADAVQWLNPNVVDMSFSNSIDDVVDRLLNDRIG
jgi:hypothetical protein|tara:strand:+ start:2764 stop:2961 length:198 start_codon:yes stop_codon:yes gene_type:complete